MKPLVTQKTVKSRKTSKTILEQPKISDNDLLDQYKLITGTSLVQSKTTINVKPLTEITIKSKNTSKYTIDQVRNDVNLDYFRQERTSLAESKIVINQSRNPKSLKSLKSQQNSAMTRKNELELSNSKRFF